jgi:hypothetical protein
MEQLGAIARMVTGALMEAWLLNRAEELDAGRGMPSWREPKPAEGAAVLPDGRSLTEERRGATVGDDTVGVCPARTAWGRRRWD